MFFPPGKTAYKYLGTIFTLLLKNDLDIQRRITPVCDVFAMMKRVLRNKKYTTNTSNSTE